MDYEGGLINPTTRFGAGGVGMAVPYNKGAMQKQSAFDALADARLKAQLDANKAGIMDYMSLIPGVANVGTSLLSRRKKGMNQDFLNQLTADAINQGNGLPSLGDLQ